MVEENANIAKVQGDTTETLQNIPIPVTIPDRFIYEVVRGKPVYYKGWKEAFLTEAETGKIQEMGSSSLQGRLIVAIIIALSKLGIDEKYVISASELGLHMGHKNNRCLDLAICDKSTYENSTKYLAIAPKVVVEVDVRADVSDWEDSESAYFKQKTQDLLDFGVEKVIWIFTDNKMVSVATQEGPWLLHDWTEAVEVIDGHSLIVGEML